MYGKTFRNERPANEALTAHRAANAKMVAMCCLINWTDFEGRGMHMDHNNGNNKSLGLVMCVVAHQRGGLDV